MTKILKSFEYKKFKFMVGNRAINDRHVNNLVKSIEKNGLIMNPSCVNEKSEIVEGQHRLMACEILNYDGTLKIETLEQGKNGLNVSWMSDHITKILKGVHSFKQ